MSALDVTTHREDYVHTPLTRPSEFRLCTIVLGAEKEELNVTMSEYLLEGAPEYSALSYAWGDGLETRTIRINGNPFTVTKSLFQALLSFRRLKGFVVMWIDQICIDQSNVEERNQQIQIMRDIYAKARTVFIWLGEADEGSDEAMEFVSKKPPVFAKVFKGHPHYFLETLSNFRNCKATDPRDKVLALLGILSDANRALYGSQGYESSTEDLFTGVARITIQNCQRLDILYAAGRSTQALELPSWVPDWSRPLLAWSLGERCDFVGDGVPYAASASSSCTVRWSNNERVLIVAGKLLSAVRRVGPEVASDLGQDDESIHLIKRAIAFETCVELAASTDPYPTGEDPLTAYSLTLVASRQLGMTKMSPEHARKQFEVVRASFSNAIGTMIWVIRSVQEPHSARANVSLPAEYPPEAKTYCNLLQDVARGKLFILTEDRYMGLAPLDTTEGDRICVILGCSVPFIVRPTVDGWILIGECYVHGLMDGEVMGMEDIEIEDVRLI
ncbi:hypothetical protein MMC30_009131 [Trapelia coarctata]|nr:hypothetical protein [Trapelia coarctata]